MSGIMLLAFASVAYAQPTSTGAMGVDDQFVEISIDDPYVYSNGLARNLAADLFGEYFNHADSTFWLGEHVDEDGSKPRIFGFTNRISSEPGVEGVGIPEDVTVDVLDRFSATWMGYEASADITTFQGVPFAYDIEEYCDIVSVRMVNTDGVSRLVVGLVFVFHVEILAPADEQADLFFERFVPIRRFFNEGQARGYAEDIARYIVPSVGMKAAGGADCGAYPAGNERDLCFCLTAIDIDFQSAKFACLGDPDLYTAFKVGMATGGVVVAGGSLRARVAKKATGFWGVVVGGVTGFVVGSGTIYGAQYTQCMIRAKSARDADVNHAMNAFYQAEANGEDFVCPSGPR